MESTALVTAASVGTAETNFHEPALSIAARLEAQRFDVEQTQQHIEYPNGLCFRLQINPNQVVFSVNSHLSSLWTCSATSYTLLLLIVLACVCIALPIWPFSVTWGILPSVVGGVILMILWTVRAVVSLVAG